MDQALEASTGPETSLPVASYATISLGLLYVVGYVASNAHFARFGPVSSGLLQVRYLSAGLLYATSMIGPLAMAATGISFVRWRAAAAGSEARSAFLRSMRSRALCTALLFLVWSGFYVVGTGSRLGLLTAWVAPVALFSLVPVAYFALDAEGSAVRSAGVAAFAILSMTVHAALFGQSVLANFSAEFGGGAGWAAQTQFVAARDTVRVSGVYVGSTDGKALFVACGLHNSELHPEVGVEWLHSLAVDESRLHFLVISGVRVPLGTGATVASVPGCRGSGTIPSILEPVWFR